MPTPKLPAEFGLPIIAGYTATMDLNLQRTQTAGGWTRQRRLWLHNPTVFELTYRLTIAQAGRMVKWLRQHASKIELKLLHGNNTLAACEMEPIDVTRISDIEIERVPRIDQVLLKFRVETDKQTGYFINAVNAREAVVHTAYSSALVAYKAATTRYDGLGHKNAALGVYPKTLPAPLSTGLREDHRSQGWTEYALIYRMDTATLAQWLAFAGAAGTRWFRVHWPVPDTDGCGNLYIRFISNPEMNLVGPNLWEVAISAESAPIFYASDTTAAPPTGTRTYDQAGATYDSPLTYEA